MNKSTLVYVLNHTDVALEKIQTLAKHLGIHTKNTQSSAKGLIFINYEPLTISLKEIVAHIQQLGVNARIVDI